MCNLLCPSTTPTPPTSANPVIRLSVNDTVVVDPGQDVFLTCEVTAGYPPPTVTWLRYPGPLPLSAQVRGPTLILRAVTPADAGFYNCTAVNNVGNPARKNVNLIVRSKCLFIPWWQKDEGWENSFVWRLMYGLCAFFSPCCWFDPHNLCHVTHLPALKVEIMCAVCFFYPLNIWQ